MIPLSSMRWAFFWVPIHAGIQGNEITDMLARGSTALRFLGPELALGGSLDKIYKRGLVTGWPTSTRSNGEVLVIPKGRLESLSHVLVWVPGQNL